jgi:hypothetical protein
MKKLIIGWREWCSLEKLGINRIEFKTDTGATLSALHATHITTFFKDAVEYVQFVTQPLKKKIAIILPVLNLLLKEKL